MATIPAFRHEDDGGRTAAPPVTIPTLPPAALLEHAAFVRRLAFHLLREDAGADDAAQETLLRAIERPPRAGSRARAWLAAVLRNVVRMRGRGAARRGARERARARPEATRGTDETAARDEILRAVVAAVATLPPLEREAVFLRHYRGLPPREIAERLGVPVATVKTRLVRAHAHLRRRLDEGSGGNVEDWRGALSAFTGLDLVSRLAPSAPGAIAMGTATKVGTGVLAAALLAGGIHLLAGRGPVQDALPPTTQPPTAPTPGLAAADRRSATDTAEPSGATAPVTPSPPMFPEDPTPEFLKGLATEVAPGRIEGIVLVGREPARDVRVRLRAEAFAALAIDAKYVPGDAVASAVTGEAGTFVLADVPGGLYTLEVAPAEAAPLFLSVAAPRGAASRRVVVVLGTRIVKGKAFDRLGRPAAGVVVLVGPSPRHPAPGTSFMARTLTGADGSYAMEGLLSGPYLASAYLSPDPVSGGRRDAEADGDPSGTTVIDLGEDRPDPVWSGVVRGTDGRPVPGPSTMWLTLEAASPYIGVEVPFDAEGRFSARVPPGTHHVRVNVTGRTLPMMFDAASRLTISEDLAQDVALPGARIRGIVRRSDTGQPFFDRNEKLFLTPQGMGVDSRLGIRLLEDGTFSTVGILPGRYAVSGWPVPLLDSAGNALTVEVREGVPEVGFDLWAGR